MNNRETFFQYITRWSGFGLTPWPAAILIHLFGIASIVMAFEESAWALLGLMAPAMLWFGTWMNYTGRWR
jgi:hypothetical protein